MIGGPHALGKQSLKVAFSAAMRGRPVFLAEFALVLSGVCNVLRLFGAAAQSGARTQNSAMMISHFDHLAFHMLSRIQEKKIELLETSAVLKCPCFSKWSLAKKG